MSAFDKQMNTLQVDWRARFVETQEQGCQNGRQYPWILPKRRWEDGLWHELRSGSRNDLPSYLSANRIQKHQGAHNLKSSWVLCANLYFSHRHDTKLLAQFLSHHVDPRIDAIEHLELEYTEPPPCDPTTLLGEPKGRRGSRQTSPDIAFIVKLTNKQNALILVENKFTEHSFYTCTGRKKKYENPDPGRCFVPDLVLDTPETHCYLLNWSNATRTNRKYWEFIQVSSVGREKLRRCPAATGGYQLFRQQALAEGIARHGRYDWVASAIAYDCRNESLIRCLKTSGIEHVPTEWGGLYNGNAEFASFTHQDWVQWVRKSDTVGKWGKWCDWLNERYGY